jgi:hypothetical protein
MKNPTEETVATIRVLNKNKRTATPHFLELAAQSEEGLLYYAPQLCEEGVNGTYFLQNKNGSSIAVFKPEDEEGNSDSNPKKEFSDDLAGCNAGEDSISQNISADSDAEGSPSSLSPLVLQHGVYPGEQATREVAAYLLDREHFYGVPSTGLVEVAYTGFTSGQPLVHSPEAGRSHLMRKKVGSLQAFVENDGSAEDVGFNAFPTKEVHKIGVLDVQIINTDRHEANILYKKNKDNSRRLIPIDHGYSLPHTLDAAWFGWLTWPQAKQPFDDEVREYIQRIDIEKDAKMLEKLGISADSVRNMKVSTTLLKKAAANNLNLYDIGALLCRVTGQNEPSEIELLVKRAEELCEGRFGVTRTAGLDAGDQPTQAAAPVDQSEEQEVLLAALEPLLDNKIEEILQKKARAVESQRGSAKHNLSLLRDLSAVEDACCNIKALTPRVARRTSSRTMMAPIKIAV